MNKPGMKQIVLTLLAVVVLVVMLLMRPSPEERAEENARCQQSEECKHFGRCTYKKDYGSEGRWACMAGSDADCEQAAVCKKHGQCSKNMRGQCVTDR